MYSMQSKWRFVRKQRFNRILKSKSHSCAVKLFCPLLLIKTNIGFPIHAICSYLCQVFVNFSVLSLNASSCPVYSIRSMPFLSKSVNHTLHFFHEFIEKKMIGFPSIGFIILLKSHMSSTKIRWIKNKNKQFVWYKKWQSFASTWINWCHSAISLDHRVEWD